MIDGATFDFTVIYPVGEEHSDKHLSATKQVGDYLRGILQDTSMPVYHFVEDCLGGFTGGLTTKQTLMKLAAMNAVVSHFLAGWGTVTHIPPVTTKRITGLKVPKGGNKKLEVIGLVRLHEPTFPYRETSSGNYAKGVDDMADAWLLATAGDKILRGEAVLGPAKKATRAGRPPRASKADEG